MLELVTPPIIDEHIKTECIDILTEIIEAVLNNEVVSIVVIAKKPDACWFDRRSGVTDFPNTIGRLEIIKQSWINEYLKDCVNA